MSSLYRQPIPDPAQGTAANGLPHESVWGYPRPPRIEAVDRRVRVALGGEILAHTDRAVRVVETAGAPIVYLCPDDLAGGSLRPASGSSRCEWKGAASYFERRLGLPEADPTVRRDREMGLLLPGARRMPAR